MAGQKAAERVSELRLLLMADTKMAEAEDMAEDMVDSEEGDDDSSSNDSDFEVPEVSEKDQEKLAELEANLKAEPSNYYVHIQVCTGSICLAKPKPYIYKQFTSSSLSYDCVTDRRLGLWMQYITWLKHCKLKGQLQSARKQMQKLFPLTSDLWLEWIKEKIQGARSPKDRAAIEELFGLATQDYLCIAIWESYLK